MCAVVVHAVVVCRVGGDRAAEVVHRLVGGEQLRAVDHIRAAPTDAARRHIGDGALGTHRAHAHRAGRCGTDKVVGGAGDSRTGRAHCHCRRAARAQRHIARVRAGGSAVADRHGIGGARGGHRTDRYTVGAVRRRIGQGGVSVEILDAAAIVDIGDRGGVGRHLRIGCKQLTAIHRIGACAAQLTCRHVGDLTLVACTAYRYHSGRRTAGEGISCAADGRTGGRHRCYRHRAALAQGDIAAGGAGSDTGALAQYRRIGVAVIGGLVAQHRRCCTRRRRSEAAGAGVGAARYRLHCRHAIV